MTDHPQRRVAVIGGGISGLAAAHRLISASDRIHVTLLEGSDRLGGIIRTETEDGFLKELGPDSFITNKPAGVQLCEEIGFTDELIGTDNTCRRSLVLRQGSPQPVPDGFMLMAPASPWAIVRTPILSLTGKLRLLAETLVPAKGDIEDESLGDFVRRRFGREALDRLVQPLVGGIYTSDPDRLSIHATLPRFPEMERSSGSVIRATLAQQRTGRKDESAGSGARYGLFTTPRQGLSSLVTAVAEAIQSSGRTDIRRSASVVSVNHGDQWMVETQTHGQELFDGVILALPAYASASLLADDEHADLRSKLQEIEYASSAIVVSTHDLADFHHPLDAFGMVVPAIEQRNILAVSFTSRKFPDRAPAGKVLLRTFVGGAMQPEILDTSDEDILFLVQQDLKAMLGMHRPPQSLQLVRYPSAMPQYHVGHMDRVRQIESLVASAPGLALAGSAFHGVGIPDSIASGRKAADDVLTDLADRSSRQSATTGTSAGS